MQRLPMAFLNDAEQLLGNSSSVESLQTHSRIERRQKASSVKPKTYRCLNTHGRILLYLPSMYFSKNPPREKSPSNTLEGNNPPHLVTLLQAFSSDLQLLDRYKSPRECLKLQNCHALMVVRFRLASLHHLCGVPEGLPPIVHSLKLVGASILLFVAHFQKTPLSHQAEEEALDNYHSRVSSLLRLALVDIPRSAMSLPFPIPKNALDHTGSTIFVDLEWNPYKQLSAFPLKSSSGKHSPGCCLNDNSRGCPGIINSYVPGRKRRQRRRICWGGCPCDRRQRSCTHGCVHVR
jgi:hypothetical protein